MKWSTAICPTEPCVLGAGHDGEHVRSQCDREMPTLVDLFRGETRVEQVARGDRGTVDWVELRNSDVRLRMHPKEAIRIAHLLLAAALGLGD